MSAIFPSSSAEKGVCPGGMNIAVPWEDTVFLNKFHNDLYQTIDGTVYGK